MTATGSAWDAIKITKPKEKMLPFKNLSNAILAPGIMAITTNTVEMTKKDPSKAVSCLVSVITSTQTKVGTTAIFLGKGVKLRHATLIKPEMRLTQSSTHGLIVIWQLQIHVETQMASSKIATYGTNVAVLLKRHGIAVTGLAITVAKIQLNSVIGFIVTKIRKSLHTNVAI